MFWITILSVSALCVGITQGSAISNCECWKGYKAVYNEDGVQCEGVNIFRIMPCNMPYPPRCVCSGQVNGILTDKTGTWCSTYQNGEEMMRWPCENTEEWNEYNKKYENFIKRTA